MQIPRREFESLSMKDREPVDSFYTRIIGLISQWKSTGENIEERITIEKTFRSFPPKFESLAMTLEENKDLSHFTIDELQASLINHKHKISRSNTSLEGAFATQSFISCGIGRGETTLEEHEEVFPEEDTSTVL